MMPPPDFNAHQLFAEHLWARLNALEYLLEVGLSHNFAAMPELESERAKDGLITAGVAGPGSGDQDDAMARQEDLTRKYIQHTVEGIDRREQAVRAAWQSLKSANVNPNGDKNVSS